MLYVLNATHSIIAKSATECTIKIWLIYNEGSAEQSICVGRK